MCGNEVHSLTKVQLVVSEGFKGPEHLSEQANRWNPAVATVALTIHASYRILRDAPGGKHFTRRLTYCPQSVAWVPAQRGFHLLFTH